MDKTMADARRAQLKDPTDISGARTLIVEARFYDDIQDALLEGAVAELKAAGVSHDVITVPGALEIPAAIAIALDAADGSGKPYDAAIALGCVIRGDTIHFEIVSIESSRALMDLAVAKRVPLGNGIITVNTVEANHFTVLIIPHTLAVTTLNGWTGGIEVNIEVDLMARYAARLTETK